MTSFRSALRSALRAAWPAATLCLLCLAWIAPADAQRPVPYRDKETATCLANKLLQPNARESRRLSYEALLERIDACVDNPDTLSGYCAWAISRRVLASDVGNAESWEHCGHDGDCNTLLRRYLDRIKASCVCTQKGQKGCE